MLVSRYFWDARGRKREREIIGREAQAEERKRQGEINKAKSEASRRAVLTHSATADTVLHLLLESRDELIHDRLCHSEPSRLVWRWIW